MKTLTHCLWPWLLALAACSGGDTKLVEHEGHAPVTYVEDEDAAMNAAMVRARTTLDEFEERLARPSGKQTMAIIKARFSEGEFTEFMWVDQLTVTDDGYRGVLGNEPVNLIGIHQGQTVDVPREDVADWVVVDDGRLVGGYTHRVLRSRLPEDERAAFDEMNGFRVED